MRWGVRIQTRPLTRVVPGRAVAAMRCPQVHLKGKRSVLVMDHDVPLPDPDTGSRSVFNIMEELAEADFNVKFWPNNLWWDPQCSKCLQDMGIEVLYADQSATGFRSWVRDNCRYLDCVVLSRPNVAIDFIDVLRQNSDTKLMFYGHDIHHLGPYIREMKEARLVFFSDGTSSGGTVRLTDQHQSVAIGAERLKIDAVISHAHPANAAIFSRSDVVFAPSFFSHMPRATQLPWLKKLSEFVKPLGLLIFTRDGETRHKTHIPRIAVDSDRYSFIAESEQFDLAISDYGHALTYKTFVLVMINQLDRVNLVEFRQGFWSTHRGTYVLRNQPITWAVRKHG